MFKTVFLFIILVVFSCNSEIPDIKTNYFDLPTEYQNDFDNALKAKKTKLTDKSFEIIQNYVQDKLLTTSNPVSNGRIISNYFWYVYNALPEFVDKNERHQGYYKGQNEQSFEQRLIAYSIYRIDRSPENIQNIFDYIKPNLKNILSKQKYQEFGLETKILGLISSYEQIIAIENYKSKLTEAYNHADTATGIIYNYDGEEVFEKFNSPYGFTASDLNVIVSQHLNVYDRHSGPNIYFPFWMRRNKEGNMETVYEILKEIQSIYNN